MERMAGGPAGSGRQRWSWAEMTWGGGRAEARSEAVLMSSLLLSLPQSCRLLRVGSGRRQGLASEPPPSTASRQRGLCLYGDRS